MTNNLDGIKKLTPDEVKKSREIVLDFIGETESINNFALENKVDSQSVIFDRTKKVDGITKGKEKKIDVEEKIVEDEVVEKKSNKQEDNSIYQEKQILISEKKKQQQLLEKQESLKQIRDKEAKLKEK